MIPMNEAVRIALEMIQRNPNVANFYRFTAEDVVQMSIAELKAVRKSTGDFQVLADVERELIKRKVLRKHLLRSWTI
jgi:hypothetical protein